MIWTVDVCVLRLENDDEMTHGESIKSALELFRRLHAVSHQDVQYEAWVRDSMSNMEDTCLRHGCIKCCLDTEMPLSSSDIARIRNLGFSDDFFIARKNGNRQLKSVSGRCVFHDHRRCVIYNHRPEGYQLYPAVLSEEIGVVVLDSYCPRQILHTK
jgi:Fe-S-cluster containining protein